MTDRDPETGKFLPGNNANPGGRARSDITLTALIDKAVTPADWDFIIKNLLKMARRGNLKAIEMLMDRRFGKPIQATDNTHTGDMVYRIEYINTPYPASDVSSGASGNTPKPKEI
jgi:hypothetical protein